MDQWSARWRYGTPPDDLMESDHCVLRSGPFFSLVRLDILITSTTVMLTGLRRRVDTSDYWCPSCGRLSINQIVPNRRVTVKDHGEIEHFPNRRYLAFFRMRKAMRIPYLLHTGLFLPAFDAIMSREIKKRGATLCHIQNTHRRGLQKSMAQHCIMRLQVQAIHSS